MSRTADGELLFGLLALQAGFVSRDQLLAAFGVWTADKSRGLDDILVNQHALDVPTRELLTALVKRHLAQHGHDPAQSLAALSSIASARSELDRLQDSDLSRSLGFVATAPNEEFATRAGTVELPGQRFEILRPHAGGGLGIVSVAKDKEVPREVALKEIRPEAANNPEARARFLREAEITGGLEHPGIVPIYGLGTYADGRPFYAMKFIKGDSLKTAIEKFHARRKEGKASYDSVDFRKLLQRFIDVCNAMQYAHDRGVLHRDLKPGNIMLGEYGETLVVDWGLAKPLGERSDFPTISVGTATPFVPRTSLGGTTGSETITGAALGTPQYMSPEQASGTLDELGPATDVYALGATLYHLLAGCVPVQGATAAEVMKTVREGRIERPRVHVPRIPKALESVCLKAMLTNQAGRYGSPRQLAEELEHWLADEPVESLPDTASEMAARFTRKHRGIVMSTIAALLLVAIISSIAAFVVNNAWQEQSRLTIEKGRLATSNGKLADMARRRADDAIQLFNSARGLLDAVQSATYDADDPVNWGRPPLRLPSSFARQLIEMQAVCERLPASELRQRIQGLIVVSRGFRIIGQYPASLAALALAERDAAPDRSLQVELLHEHGRTACIAGDFVASVKLLRAAKTVLDDPTTPLDAGDQQLRVDVTFHLGWALMHYAVLKNTLHEDPSAEQAEAVACFESIEPHYGKKSVQRGVTVFAIAFISFLQPDQTIKAMERLMQAVQILSVNGESGTFAEVLPAYASAVIQRRAGQYAAAKLSYELALARLRTALHPDHPFVAILLGDYAGFLDRDLHDSDGAEAAIREALKLGDAFSPNHAGLIGAKLAFAEFLVQKRNNISEARILYRSALDLSERIAGSDHFLTRQIRDSLSRLDAPPQN